MDTVAIHRRISIRWLIGGVALAILLVAAVLDTKFLSPQEVAELNPAKFTASDYAAKEFPKVVALIKENATDLAVLAPAIAADPAAAGRQYGQDLGSGRFAFPVKAVGTVAEVDANFIRLTVPGVPADTTVRIPIAQSLSGTPVRDATGTIKFGDFTDQTDYQAVANQFKIRMQQDVLAAIDPASLAGKQITVYGAWSSGGPPRSFLVQPVEIEVAQ